MRKLGFLVLLGLLWSCLGTSEGSKAPGEPASFRFTVPIKNFNQGWGALNKSLEFKTANKSNGTASLRDTFTRQNWLYAAVAYYEYVATVNARVTEDQIIIEIKDISFGKETRVAYSQKTSAIGDLQPLLTNNKDGIKNFNKVIEDLTKNIKHQVSVYR